MNEQKLSKAEFLRQYYDLSYEEEQSVLRRQPAANNIDEALDLEYERYLIYGDRGQH